MPIIAYADCPAGASGDMILAACLDLGLPLDYLKTELAKVALGGYELTSTVETRQGLAGRRFEVHIEHQHHHRHWRDIRAMIVDSGLGDRVKSRALAVFGALARAEARVHGVAPDDVHFHEVGAVDSIVDIVGACIALDYFQVEKLFCSPLPMGSGWVDTAHGRLPLPAPATLALLEGAATYGTGLEAELVTPTGAALLTTLSDGFGQWPAMTVTGVGLGAGFRNLPDRPNILRLILGRTASESTAERLVVAETNLDDMNPEIFPFVMGRLFSRGALDVWLTPIQMKKGRPAVQLSFLARPGQVEDLLSVLLTETTTLGVRTYPVERRAVAREVRTVDSPWGPLKVKAVQRHGREEIVPEFEDCRRLAEETGIPLKDIYAKVSSLAADE